MNTVEVYCDGSITNAQLISPLESVMTPTYVGRAVVLIPKMDAGWIKQYHGGLTNKRGNPKSELVECLAVRFAFDCCRRLGLEDFDIYNDCCGSGRLCSVDEQQKVHWASRKQMYLPNQFFDKLLGRARYLRTTKDKVKVRQPIKPYQEEIYDFWQQPELEFRLSDSALWKRVMQDASKRQPDALK